MAQHYRLTSATMALYLFIIHPGLYKQATAALQTAGKQYPNPLISAHGCTATNPKFISILQQKVRQPQPRFRVEPKLLRGVSCHDPSKFFIPPPPSAGPSVAPSAPAPLTQMHYALIQPPVIPASRTLSLHNPQTAYYTVEPPDHIMEDIEPGATTPRDVDMQGPSVPKTPSLDSNRLPFHPKYLRAPGHEVMSHDEFRAWLRSDPCTPPIYRSEPTSSGSTRLVSPSAPDNPVGLLHRRLSAEGQYTPITC
jgi:hypothetical protein